MADKSLYDILEVDSNASPEAIRVAHERLTAKYLLLSEEGTNPETKIRLEAVKEAFLILGSAEKRARYDRNFIARTHTHPTLQPAPSSSLWSGTTLAAVLILAIGGGWYHYHTQLTEQKIAADRELAEAKTREAAEQARLMIERQRTESDHVRIDMQRQQSMLNSEERIRREHERILRQHATEQQVQSQKSEYEVRRQAQEQRRNDDQRRREEQQAAAAAQAQLAREKAELCRIERERYGYALSC